MSDYALPVAAWCNHFFIVSSFQKEFVLFCCNTAKQVAFLCGGKVKTRQSCFVEKKTNLSKFKRNQIN